MPFRRPLCAAVGFAALAAGRTALADDRPPRPVDAEVTGDVAAQLYEMRSPSGQTVIGRRRLTATLGAAAYNLLDKPSDPMAPSLTFRARLRYDADYGGNVEETSPNRLDRLVPGFYRGPVDLMYGYVEGRRYLGGYLNFRLGRQYVTDALGWWSFDGGHVQIQTPYYFAVEAYGGLEQRGGLPFSTARYERDGIWRGDRSDYPLAAYPSFQPNDVAPAFGAAIETAGFTWLHGRATYRRVYNTDQRLIIYGGLACLLLVLLTYVLSRSISRPIEYLTEIIRDLLEFETSKHNLRSNIYEIKILGDAVSKLRSTLRAFTSYVPRDLVNDLLKSGQAIQPGGESRYLTVMFTDLKDFSTISEVTPSRALLRCVSAYLALVSLAVKEERGTVDKFIGDAVMAFWGAPLLDQDHAFHACATAVKSQRRMAGLNTRQVAEGLPALTVRIGIHSDAVLVGNIGSAERMSYTVMGDGVNVAARLEGINKEYGTSICISHATYKEAGERLLTRPMDVTTVKGRKGELQIYELLAVFGDDPDTQPTAQELDLCQRTTVAYRLYAAGDYTRAAESYQQIVDAHDDALSATMHKKCLHLAGQAPLAITAPTP